MKLELIPLPVADVDRAKAFYVDKLGFADDVDVRPAEGVRVVQLTPLFDVLDQYRQRPNGCVEILRYVRGINVS